MDLLAFVRSLPAHWACAPIYAKGVELPKGKKAEGKSPLGRAHHDDLSPEAAALYIERDPKTFQAIGVFTGPRSKGLVILDVDANLGAVMKKWGGDLKNAPRINSPKKNAAKFLFTVPQELWNEVSDISLPASKEGWEVLWGRQGLLAGAYHAGGKYEQEGDLNDVPEAPGWLLARMKEVRQEKENKKQSKSLKDTRWGLRSKEERMVIAESCLSVIQPQGRGSEDLWWRIGAMIHSELPCEEGLKLWREWSLQDDEYSEDWEDGKDPCLARWDAGFNANGGLGFGSLVALADHYDPDRKRFQKYGCTSVVSEIEAIPVRYRQDYLVGEELLKRAISLEESIEDPALLDQAKHLLALEAGRRDGAVVDRLIDAHLSFKRNNGGKPADIKDLDSSGFEYLIPGLFPKPWLLLVHADGGTGKSAMAMTMCKHVVQGKPFNVHGKLFQVPKGKALWLNGDQSERITRRQFNLIGVETGVDVVGEWDMQWYRRFCDMQNKGKYDLVVIDSLDGCNDSNPYEENKREYALPLKRLARRNGKDFHPCSIVVIHHNNRNGGFRGTSAIRAAVDETWNMTRLSETELVKLSLPSSTRLITVEKSRDDREGQKMTFTLKGDYTYEIRALKGRTILRGSSPNDYMLDILDQMSADTSRAWCAPDIEEDPLVGGAGKKRAIRYALERLEAQKLIERCAPPAERKFGRKPPVFYRALSTNAPLPFNERGLARGEGGKYSVNSQNPSVGTIPDDNGVRQQTPFVNSSDPGAVEAKAVDKTDLLTDPLSTDFPSAGTDLAVDADSGIHKVNWDAEFSQWDV